MKSASNEDKAFKIRMTYSQDFKQKAINLCSTHGISIVSSRIGVADSILSRWYRNGPFRKSGSGRKEPFPELENSLYNCIYKQRENPHFIEYFAK